MKTKGKEMGKELIFGLNPLVVAEVIRAYQERENCSFEKAFCEVGKMLPEISRNCPEYWEPESPAEAIGAAV